MTLNTKFVTAGRFIGKLRNKPKQLKAVLAKFKHHEIAPNKRYAAKMPDSHAAIVNSLKSKQTSRRLLHAGVLHRIRQYHDNQIASDKMIFSKNAKVPPPLKTFLDNLSHNERVSMRVQGLSPYNARYQRKLSINWQRHKYGSKATREHYKKIAQAFMKSL